MPIAERCVHGSCWFNHQELRSKNAFSLFKLLMSVLKLERFRLVSQRNSFLTMLIVLRAKLQPFVSRLPALTVGGRTEPVPFVPMYHGKLASISRFVVYFL